MLEGIILEMKLVFMILLFYSFMYSIFGVTIMFKIFICKNKISTISFVFTIINLILFYFSVGILRS